jgi:hypothetical protein
MSHDSSWSSSSPGPGDEVGASLEVTGADEYTVTSYVGQDQSVLVADTMGATYNWWAASSSLL